MGFVCNSTLIMQPTCNTSENNSSDQCVILLRTELKLMDIVLIVPVLVSVHLRKTVNPV